MRIDETAIDSLAIGGGMANTFLAAQGISVGKSLCEHDLAETAREIMQVAKENNCNILLPVDVVVAKDFKAHAENRTCATDEVADDEMILDAGVRTIAQLVAAMGNSKTLVWNGPLGAFELTPFDKATVDAAQAAGIRAKDGKLKPEEYQGGTASLSNMGMFGIKQFEAVINPPQAMIMAIGAGEKRPYIVDDAVQIATVMSATGSFDHRAIDGADGARLMQVFKELIENPMGLLA